MGRHTGHLKFQSFDVLTRLGGNELGELEIVLSGEYVGDDVWSVEGGPLGDTESARAEVDANDANVFTSERLTTERAGRGQTRRSLGDNLFTAA